MEFLHRVMGLTRIITWIMCATFSSLHSFECEALTHMTPHQMRNDTINTTRRAIAVNPPVRDPPISYRCSPSTKSQDIQKRCSASTTIPTYVKAHGDRVTLPFVIAECNRRAQQICVICEAEGAVLDNLSLRTTRAALD